MLLRISFFLVALSVLTDWYIYARFIKAATPRRDLRLLHWVPTGLLTAILVYLLTGEIAGNHNVHWGGLYIIAYMTIVIPKILFCLCALIGQTLHPLWRPLRRIGIMAGLLAGIAGMWIVLYGTFIGWKRFTVHEVTYTSPDLPEAFDGYRITQLSDMHIGTIAPYPKQVQRLVDKVNAQGSDLIVFTGDLVNHRADELDGAEEILSRLHAPDGVYSVLGNHDFSPYLKWESPEAREANLQNLIHRQEQMGWHMLHNAHTLIHRGDTCIALIGVQNESFRPMLHRGDLPKAMEGTGDRFKILLSHAPEHWRHEVLGTDIDLMLAGHTHAMQFKLFGFTPASWFFSECAGMYREGKQALYVNAGIGEVMLPFRFGAWPEITVLTLRRE